jgi:4-hydroxy-4-methyl-2-oxoglutarate aldolase
VILDRGTHVDTAIPGRLGSGARDDARRTGANDVRPKAGGAPRAARNPPDPFAKFRGFDAATVYEAAGRRGMLDPAIRPAWTGARVCGPALTVRCPPGDNLMLHRAVATASAGCVIVADAGGHLMAGAWGEILTVAALARRLGGLVIDGAVRDIEAIATLRFPVFSRGLAVGACTKERRGRLGRPLAVAGVRVSPGDLVFGGAEGVVVVARDRVDAAYRAALDRRRRERAVIRGLRRGQTTLELLGLDRIFDGGARGGERSRGPA